MYFILCIPYFFVYICIAFISIMFNVRLRSLHECVCVCVCVCVSCRREMMYDES